MRMGKGPGTPEGVRMTSIEFDPIAHGDGRFLPLICKQETDGAPPPRCVP